MAASKDHSISSVSTSEFSVIEPTDNQSSVHVTDRVENEPPVIIPMDMNDEIISEKVTCGSSKLASFGLFRSTPSSANTNFDLPTLTPTAVKPKFVIRGGTVLRTPDTTKEEMTIDPVPLSPGLESSEIVCGPLACKIPILPQEKSGQPTKRVLDKNKANVSDGWSTEDEVDDSGSCSHVGGDQLEVLVSQK